MIQELLKDWVLRQDQIPEWGRVVLGMALVLGLFGSLFLGLRKRLQRSMAIAQKAVKSVVRPAWMAVHIAAFAALFAAYSWYWNLAL